MKILIVDRDALSSQLIRSKLEAMGHQVVEEPVKNNALTRMETEEFDVVFFDPSPLNNPRPVVLSIRRSVRNYPYIILISQDMDKEEAVKSGVNEVMSKPLDASLLDGVIEDSKRMIAMIQHMGDESEDFPSAGGVIAKSAFNQLFLSAVDRADRYGERSFLLFIGVDNYQEILELDGKYAAAHASAKLSQYLVRLRRQSDIIAQVGKAEFCLMLQRPMYESEPMEAASRFAEALGKLDDIVPSEGSVVNIKVELLDIPVCRSLARHIITKRHGDKSAAEG